MECTRIDELMMEYLYRELDAGSAAQFKSHVDSCTRCSAELAGLERTRKAIRSLPESDPPPSVTALLLHEAAKRAPTDGEQQKGFWAWFTGLFAPIAAHPALAAAASLILVAGVAGYLSMRGLVTDTSSGSQEELRVERPLEVKLEEPEAAPAAKAPETTTDEPNAPAETPPGGYLEQHQGVEGKKGFKPTLRAPLDEVKNEESRRGRYSEEAQKKAKTAVRSDKADKDVGRGDGLMGGEGGAGVNTITPGPSRKAADPAPRPKMAEPPPEPAPAPVMAPRPQSGASSSTSYDRGASGGGGYPSGGAMAQPAPTTVAKPSANKPAPTQAPAAPPPPPSAKESWDDAAPQAEMEKAEKAPAKKPAATNTKTREAAQKYVEEAKSAARGKGGCPAAVGKLNVAARYDSEYTKKSVRNDPLLEKCATQQNRDKKRLAPAPAKQQAAPDPYESDSAKDTPAAAH